MALVLVPAETGHPLPLTPDVVQMLKPMVPYMHQGRCRKVSYSPRLSGASRAGLKEGSREQVAKIGLAFIVGGAGAGVKIPSRGLGLACQTFLLPPEEEPWAF